MKEKACCVLMKFSECFVCVFVCFDFALRSQLIPPFELFFYRPALPPLMIDDEWRPEAPLGGAGSDFASEKDGEVVFPLPFAVRGTHSVHRQLLKDNR